MTTFTMITIHSAKQKNLSEQEFQKLYSIIVKAYADTESEMWGKNYVRVSELDFRKFIAADEILVAFLNDNVVGGLRYYRSSEDTFGFGLFGADFSLSGKGIGRALINRVEEEVKKSGCKKIKIEILRPKNFELPIKKVLHNWYQRLRYMHTGTVDFAEEFPDRAIGILVPCVFDYYVKEFER
ncbi:MAG: GNAT family N-acetyltransferase [Crocinitomicaceae bacterium]|nr:GNAT family N-acetyltransferase [Crocinitomicaceae bacterium]